MNGKKQAGEKILVIINPSEKDVTFPCNLKKLGGAASDLENPLYSFGRKIRIEGKNISVAGKSAGFFELSLAK